jgi:hypothetical protein
LQTTQDIQQLSIDSPVLATAKHYHNTVPSSNQLKNINSEDTSVMSNKINLKYGLAFSVPVSRATHGQ